MSLQAAIRYKMMLGWAWLLRILLPYGKAMSIASGTIRWFHPGLGKQKPAFMDGLDSVLADRQLTDAAWKRHTALVGVNRFQSSYYAQPDTSWIEKCRLDIEGGELVRQCHDSGKGVLVMTYHLHLNMLFCNMMARIGLPVTTIAMDDRENTRLPKRVENIHAHAARLVNGGDLILVKPNNQVRPIMRAFEKNHLVISANDFPGVFDDKNRRDFPFLNTTLSCPTGTVKYAVKKQIPVVASYLDWLGGNHFRLVNSLVSDGTGDTTVEDVMAGYLAVLEKIVEQQPGLWEGWKWLGNNHKEIKA